MKRALLSNIQVIPGVAEDTVIDRQGYLSAIVAANISAIGATPTITFDIKTSDTEDGTFNTVGDPYVFVEGSGGEVEINQNYNIDIDLLGCKQYIMLVPTASDGVTATYAVALGDSRVMPV